MGGKVLVVDDDETVRDVVELLLRHEHEVKVVSDGNSALAAAAETDFDVVVLDYQLPDMMGTEVGFVLRKTSPHMRVLVFSAVQEGADKLDPVWADLFVAKGDVSELPEVIARAVGWKRETDAWLMETPKRWPTPRYLPLRRNGDGSVTGFLRSFGDSARPVVYLLSEWPVPEGYFDQPNPHYEYADFEALISEGWRVATPLSSRDLRERRNGAGAAR